MAILTCGADLYGPPQKQKARGLIPGLRSFSRVAGLFMHHPCSGTESAGTSRVLIQQQAHARPRQENTIYRLYCLSGRRRSHARTSPDQTISIEMLDFCSAVEKVEEWTPGDARAGGRYGPRAGSSLGTC